VIFWLIPPIALVVLGLGFKNLDYIVCHRGKSRAYYAV